MKVNNKEITIVTQCPFCGGYSAIDVNENDYLDWKDGANAQDAFPYLSSYEREKLISGICLSCWEQLFNAFC